MENKFTIFLTYFAPGTIRRQYISIFLNTLFNNFKMIKFPTLIIDASPKRDANENRKLFKRFKNLKYINDFDPNPFTRCNKYLSLIKTDYVLRLLEDCAYINLGENNFKFIKKDMKFLNNSNNFDLVQYPIINEQSFRVKNNTVLYPKINFNKINTKKINNHEFYDRSIERKINHYLCNNYLCKSIFFKKHWSYITKTYDNHNEAEAGKPKFKIFKYFKNKKYIRGLLYFLFRLKEKTINRDSIIKKIAVTETMKKADVIHIGYYSTEKNTSNFLRKNLSKKANLDGVVSTIENLQIFNNLQFLKKIKFNRLRNE